MNKHFIKKIFTLSTIMMFTLGSYVNAETITKTLKRENINQNTVSISVRDTKNGNVIYELNAQRLHNPASTLKLITYMASLDTLGKNYEFKTELYKSTNNDLYLKIGADPFLTSKNLQNIFEDCKNKKITEPKNIYIDDSIFDKNEWGEGWQWDDDLNPLMPKFSSYNLDKNLMKITVSPTTQNAPANIYNNTVYPITFMNFVQTGTKNDIKISRYNNISPDMLTVEGTIHSQENFIIPINNPRRYFKLQTEDILRDEKIEYYKDIQNKKLPSENIYLVSSISHPISLSSDAILKHSNNFVAETIFKLAGSKYTKQTGSNENSEKMLYDFLKKNNIDYSNIKIVDGSGVSKNNLITAEFMTDFLIKMAAKEDFEDFKNSMATTGEGTLTNRMLYFGKNLYAKTGTLSDVSAIAGYLTTQKGKLYAFDIMITDPKTKSSNKKDIEESILRTIFNSY